MAMTKTRDYVSVDPVSSPVTVEDARLHLDLDDNYYDSQLDRLIDVARRRVEQDTRRSLVTQTHVLSMDTFPSNGIIELPTAPVQSVTSVTYVDTADATYVSGYGSTVASVDPVAKFAILMLVSHLFNSPSVTAHGSVNIVPIGYESLIDSLKWGQYP